MIEAIDRAADSNQREDEEQAARAVQLAANAAMVLGNTAAPIRSTKKRRR